ncbi:Mitochondrial arginine transporter BAC1 [Glycine soja]
MLVFNAFGAISAIIVCNTSGLLPEIRESIGNVVFFSVYEYVCYYMHSNIKAASSNYTNLVDIGIGIVSGGLGGVAFWLTVLPLDVAKTLIQTNPDKNCPRNPFRVLSSIYQRAGFNGCYTGLGPTVSRAFPANAATIALSMTEVGSFHLQYDDFLLSGSHQVVIAIVVYLIADNTTKFRTAFSIAF